MAAPETVLVEGRRVRLTNLDKVLYPATGTTKADVVAYLTAVAPALLPHTAERPATRKRWPDGTAGQVFFQKNLDAGTPPWVRRRPIEHRSGTTEYALVGDLPTLVWLGQTASLEIHVPQWRFGRTGVRLAPDRLVLDLDPGPGVGLPECAEVARWARAILADMGLAPLPVTSGSKGLHLYAALDGSHDADQVSAVAHELARALEADHPDLVVSDMRKALREGRVLVDWSQNNGAKTTIAPYSPRGRERPTVAAPRTWDELDDPGLDQLEMDDVVARLGRDGDLLAPLTAGHLAALEPTPARMATFDAHPPEPSDRPDRPDRLARYRSMRDPGRTPEPVPGEAPPPSSGRSFVIQEHHARRWHLDLRLEHDGVLVSWALPRGEPEDPAQNHLAVQTEDHPLAYGAFEGTIPGGEYGAGEVSIWDAGTYDLEKWREGEEVIAVLHGEARGTRRIALIRTGGRGGPDTADHWLVHRMKEPGAPAVASSSGNSTAGRDAARATAADAATPSRTWRPMLATARTEAALRSEVGQGDAWAFEMKWDGVRCLARVRDGVLRLASRSGADTTATYPELGTLATALADGVQGLVLDGEVVALDADGRPSFRRLQRRMNVQRSRDVEAARRLVGVDYMVFDLLELDGRPLDREPWSTRRRLLDEALVPSPPVHVPPALDDVDDALRLARAHDLEGVVAKRRDSTYAVGRRSSAWVKVKRARTQEAVVVGWRPGHDSRAHLLGSLLLAVPDGDGLRYVGRVGSGFTDRERQEIPGRFVRLARRTPPAHGVPDADAADARWVSPRDVVEVLVSGWTGEAPGTGSVRHAVWRGWRPDKRPEDVVVEAVLPGDA